MSDLLGIAIPLGLLFAGGYWLVRYQMTSYGRHVAHIEELNERHSQIAREAVAEQKRTNVLLEEVRDALTSNR